MALDFPANPTDGQVYGSYVYSSTSGVWKAREESAAPAVVSPVPPTSANPGDIWVDSSDGIAYVRYNDGTSSQWIELMSSGVPQLASKANLSGATFTGDVTVGTSGTNIRADNGIASFVTNSPTKVAITAKAAAGQSGNIQEWQSSDGTPKSYIDSVGRFIAVNTSPQTTVAASNGTGAMELRATATTAAAMSFHVPGVFAVNMGAGPDSKFSIGGWSMGANALTLDSTGRMTLQYQPSFEVTGAGATNGTNTFVYPTVLHNVGGHYNTSNGRFTAPVSGRYFFEATAGNNADYYADLSINGNIRRRVERRNGSASIGYFWQTTCLVVQLAAGDYASFIVNYGTANSSSPYAGFSGYFLG